MTDQPNDNDELPTPEYIQELIELYQEACRLCNGRTQRVRQLAYNWSKTHTPAERAIFCDALLAGLPDEMAASVLDGQREHLRVCLSPDTEAEVYLVPGEDLLDYSDEESG
jgi:hypothetical protein